MVNKTYQKGDEVFYMGDKWTVEYQINDQEYLLSQIYQDEENKFPQYVVANKYYFCPENPFDSEKVKEYQAQIKKVEEELKLKLQLVQLAEQQKENYLKDAQALQQRHKAVRRIIDFLDGKITHYVIETWNGVVIVQQSKSFHSNDREDQKESCLRMLSLYGKAKGDLEWRLHRYNDRSGNFYETVIPCTSEQEAQDEAMKIIRARIAEEKSVPRETLPEFALQFPDIQEAIKKDKENDVHRIHSNIAELEKQIKKEYEKISEIEKS